MVRFLAAAALLSACGPVPMGTKGTDNQGDSGSEEAQALSFGGVDITPSSVDFGAVAIGNVDEATVSLTNTLSSEVMVSNAYVSGSNEFAMVDDIQLPHSMSSDTTQVVTIEFTPGDTERVHATLYVGVAGEVGYAEIPLAGRGKNGGSGGGGDTSGATGGTASISASPSSVDFGSVPVLSSSSQTLTITNTGTKDVLLTGMNITNSAFSIGSGFTVPVLIVPSASASIPLTFEPSGEGLFEAILDIDTDPSGASIYVDLTGLGTASECTICAPLLSISTSTGGSASLDLLPTFGFGCTAAGSVVLSNAGDQVLDINRVSVNNDVLSTCGEFSRSWEGPTSLEPGTSTTVAVDYVADGTCLDLPYAALDQNVMHVRTNDPDVPDAVVELSGTVLLCD